MKIYLFLSLFISSFRSQKVSGSEVKNLKTTYTRKLLEQLPQLSILDYSHWVKYMVVLFTMDKDYIDAVIENYPALSTNMGNFLLAWGDRFIEELNQRFNR